MQSDMFKYSSKTFVTRASFADPLLFVLHVCHAVLCPSSLVVFCWERADLLARLYVKFSCVFVTFPYGSLGQVWYFLFYRFQIFAFLFTFNILSQYIIFMFKISSK